MRKIGHRAVVKAARMRKESERRVNVTFRLPKGVLGRFRALCAKEGLTMTDLIEEFMMKSTGV